MVADLLPGCCPRVLLGIRRGWRGSCSRLDASGEAAALAAVVAERRANRLRWKPGRSRDSRHFGRLLIARSISADSIAKTSPGSPFISPWWWIRPAHVWWIGIGVPETVGIRRWRISRVRWEICIRPGEFVHHCRRKAERLRRCLIGISGRLRRVSERLYTVRV